MPAQRIVAYYGGPDGPGLGVLGAGTPDQAADAVTAQASQYAAFGRPVRGAMELITQVARSGPGPDGLYSSPIPDAQVQAYLDAAHRHNLLLILDIQPGRGQFLPQVQRLARFLADPIVSIGLDPEWKVGPGQVPGQVIGSSTSGDINAVSAYLSGIVRGAHLPDKLMIVHQFTLSMLPDRSAITIPAGVEVVFHADGNSSPAGKTTVFHQLGFPGAPYGTGFKLFLTQDSSLMTPAQVMALSPQPDVITYQ